MRSFLLRFFSENFVLIFLRPLLVSPFCGFSCAVARAPLKFGAGGNANYYGVDVIVSSVSGARVTEGHCEGICFVFFCRDPNGNRCVNDRADACVRGVAIYFFFFCSWCDNVRRVVGVGRIADFFSVFRCVGAIAVSCSYEGSK